MSTSNFTALAEQLRRQAEALATAGIAARGLRPGKRWRRAALLWPLFTKG